MSEQHVNEGTIKGTVVSVKSGQGQNGKPWHEVVVSALPWASAQRPSSIAIRVRNPRIDMTQVVEGAEVEIAYHLDGRTTDQGRTYTDVMADSIKVAEPF